MRYWALAGSWKEAYSLENAINLTNNTDDFFKGIIITPNNPHLNAFGTPTKRLYSSTNYGLIDCKSDIMFYLDILESL